MTSAEWVTRHRAEPTKLAQAVSLATTIEPELLRAARLDSKLCRGIGAEAEAEVWFSPLVESRSPIGIVFSAEALDLLWDSLKGNTPLLDAMRALTKEYHKGIAPALEWEEEIVYHALAGGADAAQKIEGLLQQILKTMLDPDNRRMAVWAERALPRLPDAVRQNPVHALVAQAAFERGGRVAAMPGATAGPAWLKPPAKLAVMGVRLYGRAVAFSYPPEPDSITATVPESNPLKLLLSDNPSFARSGRFPREVTVPQGVTVREHIDLVPELYIRPAAGRAFIISPALDAAVKPKLYLASSREEDRELEDFIYSQLKSEFEVDRNQQDAAGAIAQCDVLIQIRSDSTAHPFEELAQRECRRIIYALAASPEHFDPDANLTVIDCRDRASWPAAVNELTTVLRLRYEAVGLLSDVPPLPPGYKHRSDLFDRARDFLMNGQGRLALYGEPGVGASTLAAGLARDCRVRRRFPNGIYWVYANSRISISGPKRLFIFDCAIGDAPSGRDFDGSAILFTKAPDKDWGPELKVPGWPPEESILPTPLQEQALRTYQKLVNRALVSGREYPIVECLTMLLEVLPPAYSGAARALSVFVPDARLQPDVYGRLIQTDYTLDLLQEGGFIKTLPDRSVIVRSVTSSVIKTDYSLHEQLVGSYEAECEGDWALGPNDGYYFHFLIDHLWAVGRSQEAETLIHDLDWLLGQWRNAGYLAVERDLARFPMNDQRFAVHSVLADFADDVQPRDLARAINSPRTLARQLFWDRGAATWILVIGSGSVQVPDAVVFASEVLGRELARAGYGLLSGGWPGVDHIVCREYVKQLRRDQVPSTGRLVHVLADNNYPDFWVGQEYANEGDRDASGSPQDAMLRSIERAGGVITIGGMGATYTMIREALLRQRPVFPIAATGGDSEKAYLEVPSAYRRRGSYIAGREFLAQPIRSRRDAREIVKAIIDALPPAGGGSAPA